MRSDKSLNRGPIRRNDSADSDGLTCRGPREGHFSGKSAKQTYTKAQKSAAVFAVRRAKLYPQEERGIQRVKYRR